MKYAVSLVTILVSVFPATTGADQAAGYGHHMWHGGGWMGWFAGPLMMIAMIAVVVAVVIALIRWLGGSEHGPAMTARSAPAARSPLDILKERFAKGEIDKEEFEERKRVLES